MDRAIKYDSLYGSRSDDEHPSGSDVEVVSKLGEGTTFIVRLPLTLAIIQALMVEVSGEKYALPLNSIVTVEEILPEDIRYVHTKEVINLRGSVIPLVRLNEVKEPDRPHAWKDRGTE